MDVPRPTDASQLRNPNLGTSLVIQQLRLCASTARDTGLIPVGGRSSMLQILRAVWCGQKKMKLQFRPNIHLTGEETEVQKDEVTCSVIELVSHRTRTQAHIFWLFLLLDWTWPMIYFSISLRAGFQYLDCSQIRWPKIARNGLRTQAFQLCWITFYTEFKINRQKKKILKYG